ncbi:MAG: hypothetical protein J6A83_03555 [Clostridia bacterium]|nr:hypothetical protein [Clostridia bacterium]
MRPHRRNDINREAVIKRILVWGALLFILAVAQCSFFTGLTFMPAVPNILLGAVAAISVFDTQRSAAVCGIAAGFLGDALGGSGISLSPLALLVVAIVSAELSKKLIPNFFTWAVLLIPASLIGSVFTFVNLFISFGRPSFASVFKSILLPELLMTVICSLPLFFIVKLCARLIDAKGKFKI